MMAAPRARGARWRRRSILPGFGLSLGYTVAYLSLIVLIPLTGLVFRSATLGWDGFWDVVADDRVARALQLSFGAALAAAVINTVFGLIVAWVLVRYRFPGRRWLDAAVDLPFALPTAVAGIALANLYAPNGPFGFILDDWFGIKVGFTPLGVVMALVFVGLPFVVRTVQPVLEDIERDTEEVAATLGAGRLRIVTRVMLPTLLPAILTGFALSFARGVGEYGSVIFIAGNLPYVSEIAPLLIVIRLEENNYAGATAIALIMLAISFASLLVINLIQAASRRWFGHV
ncbi:MAG: sulfate ABC transporter permease subunit CysT [Alphaproteobacteria bacterium]|nr:sulfate ABC transporter permease subunit CysT [Alphaproteobacteria bacterium]